jgi:pentatricopeptide repeat protein
MRGRHAATVFAVVAHGAYAVADRLTNPFAGFLVHDAARYDAWARAIVAGQVFEPGAFSQAPLYPYLVAALYAIAGPHSGAVVALQVVLGAATVALVGRAAAAAFDETTGAWASWLCALYGVLAFFETKLVPVTVVVALAALAIERMQAADRDDRTLFWLPAGVAAGLLGIAHAASFLLIPLGAVWIGSDRSRTASARAARALLFVGTAAALAAPVAWRNAAAGGGHVLVSDNGGITFWQGNNPVSVGVYSTPEGFTGSIDTQREESRRLAAAATGRALRDDEVSAYWFSRGRAFLAGDLPHAAWLIGRKMLLSIASTEQPLEYSPRLDAVPLRFLFPLPFAALLSLALLGIGPTFRTRAAQPALLVCAAPLVVLLAFYVASRYRLPLVPGLAIMAGRGAAYASLRSWPVRAAVLAAAIVSVLWFPLAERGLAAEQDAASVRDLATALRETGRIDEAIAAYRRSLTKDADAPYTHLDLGKALARAGKGSEAEAEVRETLRLAPGIGEAHFDLGVIAFDSGRLEEAASSFQEAWRLAPADAAASNNLAGTYLKLGRVDDARRTIRTMRERGIAVDPPLARSAGE